MSKPQKAIDPIAAIHAEAEKARRSADKIGIMSIKSANEWVDDALTEPDPKRYFYGLLVEGECTVIIAASNTGKSIFTTQMAEAVARENVVLYLDCELSSKQFQMRYVESDTHVIHRFPDTLLRAELRLENIVDTGLEQAILDSIAAASDFPLRALVSNVFDIVLVIKLYMNLRMCLIHSGFHSKNTKKTFVCDLWNPKKFYLCTREKCLFAAWQSCNLHFI